MKVAIFDTTYSSSYVRCKSSNKQRNSKSRDLLLFRNPAYYLGYIQADDRSRTDNLLLTRQLLCQLSYIGNVYGEINHITKSLLADYVFLPYPLYIATRIYSNFLLSHFLEGCKSFIPVNYSTLIIPSTLPGSKGLRATVQNPINTSKSCETYQ